MDGNKHAEENVRSAKLNVVNDFQDDDIWLSGF